MKYFFLACAALYSSFTFSQNNGAVTGTVLDGDMNNIPLFMAEVLIYETGQKAITNAQGVFELRNLNYGAYTVVCNFTGYEAKKIKIQVAPGTKNQLQFVLNASSISLDDLGILFSSTAEHNNNGVESN